MLSLPRSLHSLVHRRPWVRASAGWPTVVSATQSAPPAGKGEQPSQEKPTVGGEIYSEEERKRCMTANFHKSKFLPRVFFSNKKLGQRERKTLETGHIFVILSMIYSVFLHFATALLCSGCALTFRRPRQRRKSLPVCDAMIKCPCLEPSECSSAVSQSDDEQ